MQRSPGKSRERTRSLIRRSTRSLVALMASAALLGPAIAEAGNDSRFGTGTTLHVPSKLKKSKKLGELVATVAIPKDIIQSEPMAYDCSVQTLVRSEDNVEGIENVRANWATSAYVMDHRDSSFRVLDVATGVIKTSTFGNGYARQIQIPPDVSAAIFADGFESGDISAWLMTTAKLKKGKKLNHAMLQCNLAESGR